MKNDRLRFRAWDPQDQRHYDGFLLHSDGEGVFTPFPRGKGKDEGGLIIEQCTGLKDKNGNLIYEGDIVMYSNNLTGAIVFIMGCFCVKDSMGFGDYAYTPIYRIQALQIVGNIHENSEFMGKNK